MLNKVLWLTITGICIVFGITLLNSQPFCVQMQIVYAEETADKLSVVVGEIRDINNVYDGDTINEVYFKICDPCDLLMKTSVEHIPIVKVESTLYYVNDVRLTGIDTPEIKPRKADHATEELRQREKRLAILARDHVRDLLKSAYEIRLVYLI